VRYRETETLKGERETDRVRYRDRDRERWGEVE